MARTTGKRLKIDLGPAIEAMGVDRIIEQMGVKRVLDEVGEREIVKWLGLDRILAGLSPTERRELKKRLQ